MRRREFIALLGGAAAACPFAGRAQQAEPMRRIGILMNRTANEPEGQARVAAFKQALHQLGWREGGNVQIDIRWGEDKNELERKYAAELVALAPDLVFASGTLSVSALQNLSRTLPIVFAAVADPVGAGFVNSLARPGSNATGYMIYEYSLSGKWLELLRQMVPGLRRVAVLRDPSNPAGIAVFGAIQATAQPLGVEVSPVSVRDAAELERAIVALARLANGGLIVTPSASVSVQRDLIIDLAARHKLPAIYSLRYLVAKGGLFSYGPDIIDHFRRAAGYVDRILKGEKTVDLPVQAPVKYELAINLKTAKALGLTVPSVMLARADEVIE
jgi:putative ABC transport system substrate-binding protein